MDIKIGLYRHFKGNLYEVLGTATHSETREPMVVYRALYGEYGFQTRLQPLGRFLNFNSFDTYSGISGTSFRKTGDALPF